MRTFVYPGSFDPPTLGHLDLIRRGRLLCDELVVAVLPNTAKKTVFTAEERENMLKLALKEEKGVRVLSYTGLTADLCRELRAAAILHGLRNVKDYLYEASIADINRQIGDGCESIFLQSRAELAHISSSLVRELAHFNKEDYARLVPEVCLPILEAGFARFRHEAQEEDVK